MRIINIVEISYGLLMNVKSYPILDDQLSSDVVKILKTIIQ